MKQASWKHVLCGLELLPSTTGGGPKPQVERLKLDGKNVSFQDCVVPG